MGNGNIPKSHRFYRFLLNGNPNQFISIFSKNTYLPPLILRVHYIYGWKSFLVSKKFSFLIDHVKLKVGLSSSEKHFICSNEGPLRKMKINFLFHLKSSFRSQDVQRFVFTFLLSSKKMD